MKHEDLIPANAARLYKGEIAPHLNLPQIPTVIRILAARHYMPEYQELRQRIAGWHA
jgi:hypothetical protein